MQPRPVTAELLATYVERGVTRVSLGVSRGRATCSAPSGASTTLRTLNAAWPSSGFRSATFNLDVIYGAAGETLDDWRAHSPLSRV